MAEDLKYQIYKIHYGFTSKPIGSNVEFVAEVAPTGLKLYDRLTESEDLLKEAIDREGKPLELYVLYGIEKNLREDSDITGVLSNEPVIQ